MFKRISTSNLVIKVYKVKWGEEELILQEKFTNERYQALIKYYYDEGGDDKSAEYIVVVEGVSK